MRQTRKSAEGRLGRVGHRSKRRGFVQGRTGARLHEGPGTGNWPGPASVFRLPAGLGGELVMFFALITGPAVTAELMSTLLY